MKMMKFTLTALIFTVFSTTAISQVDEEKVDPSTIFADIEDTSQYDMLALAKMNENLSTFVELVESSGMAASVDMSKKYTVFVPTNQAFEQLSKEKYEELTDPKNKAMLLQVLYRHVLPNRVLTNEFEDSQVITTSGDEEITISKEGIGSNVFIGGAEIIKSDIEASNGIMHIVDGVVTPTANVIAN